MAVAAWLALLPWYAGPAAAQSSARPQSRFLGSVPTGEATATTLPLSLKDTFDGALKYNLGLLESDQDVRTVAASAFGGHRDDNQKRTAI